MSRVSRAKCSNCTCSPGLLSRTHRRSSWLAKQVNIARAGSTSPRDGSRKGTIYTLDAASLCASDVKEINTSKRLERLRILMKEYDLGLYIIPSEDQHQSEYVSSVDQRRSFISGFSGSAGVAIVTRDVTCMNDTPEGLAALSTDGRYFRQATNELDFNWILLRQGSKSEPTWEEWVVNQATQLSYDSGKKIKIGVDPKLVTYQLVERFQNLIAKTVASNRSSKAEVELSAVSENLVDKIWSEFEEIPLHSLQLVKSLPMKYTGKSICDKINEVIHELKQTGSYGLVVSALDEIAWLLNLRGSDIEFNPVFYGYVILTVDRKLTLYTNDFRFDEITKRVLSQNGIRVQPYSEFWAQLRTISDELQKNSKKMLVTRNISWEVIRNINCSYELSPRSLIEDLKGIKNETELQGAREAHLKDGRAICRFFAWIENELITNGTLIDECEADEKLKEFREEEENFVGLSFATISATGANGAIIHYKPIKGSCSVIDPNKMYLIDTGSQFLEGTTDTTRTVHFTNPSAEEITNYTLVLKGNLSLGLLKFPDGTTGSQIDSIARQHLWSHGLDYGHGTSHGIGAYLNVHEGPIGIGPRTNSSNVLKPGHLVSNEPGYYKDGSYGIRIENVMYVKQTSLSFAGKRFYEFHTVTRVPFCRKLIDVSMLSPAEKEWINSYHELIWKELSPTFIKHGNEYNWLRRETSAL